MSNLINYLIYILAKYPHKDELSNARVTKLIYLFDWYASMKYHTQFTNIQWYFDNYGPYVHDIYNTIQENQEIFKITYTENFYGNEKCLFELRQNIPFQLPLNEQELLDQVISDTKTMHWAQFINYIYSTYPIASSNRYSHLDLVQKAKEFSGLYG